MTSNHLSHPSALRRFLQAQSSAGLVLMGAAATLIAKLLHKYRFIAWIGLLVILFVALRMIWHGWEDVACHVQTFSSFCSAIPVEGTTP